MRTANIVVPNEMTSEGNTSELRDFIALMKPRVMSLVIFTSLVGLMIAPGHIHPVLGFTTILCISLGAGASAIINNWYDRDIDRLMVRTQNRALPAKRVAPQDALAFGVFLAVLSIAILALCVNLLSGLILAVTIGFYVFIYTMWLKRTTPQNIVIGGAAGAFPPMISWAAVTGDITLMPVVLFLIIFLWTPPHFWALALYKCKDYQKAGVPMMPVVKGDLHTKKQMIFYTLLLIPVTLAPYFLSVVGLPYLAIVSYLNLVFLYLGYKVYKDPAQKLAPRMFGFSILYLFAIFLLLMLDHRPI
ncbi:MAG: heme o synthase [Alphaproteobacteria bacterium]|nr:heme o synthase [Alphaproteobacteria bacterium]